MFTILGIPGPLLFGQLLLGLINGAFYAMLSLGLAVIFGMLGIINFAHGALFMLGAFVAWMLLEYVGIGYFPALILAPLIVGAFGIVMEKTIISRLYKLDHLYGLLLTFGVALILEGLFRNAYGSSGLPYRIPAALQGATNLGFMFLPNYRAWVVIVAVVVCVATWGVIEKTSLGARLRAATENPGLVQAFGVNVPRLITLTYAGGVALAAFAGVLAAPIYSVNPGMGSAFINTVFAVVVIGGMGSIMGSIVTGFGLGVVEGLTKVFYPQASATVVFLVMVIVLLSGRAGCSERRPDMATTTETIAATPKQATGLFGFTRPQAIAFGIMVLVILLGPTVLYPVFLMKVLCFALFACAFNLLLGYVGLLSFGHAAYFGMGCYVTAWVAKHWGLPAEIAILLGGLAGGGLGLLLGWIAIRRQGLYFAMITLALGQMVYFFCLQAPFTGGEDGIQQVPRLPLFGLIPLQADLQLYWLVAAVFLIGFLFIHRVVHSPFGQVLKAIRENEPRATSLGYRTDDYKLMAFVLSTFLAGIAGGTKSLVFGIATLTDVHSAMSGEVVLMTLVGGLGTIFGPVVGALFTLSLENYLAPFGAWVTVSQGVIFVICVLAFRRGIIGEIAGRLKLSL